MFLASGTAGAGVSGAIAPTGVPIYDTSRDGGTEQTLYEGVESGAGPYAGPNMEHTRPLTDYYVPQPLISPIDTVAVPAVPQGPNPYADTLGASATLSPTPMATTQKTDCGCGGDCAKLPWYVLVGLVVAVVLLLKD
jgi:hypothetical protein